MALRVEKLENLRGAAAAGVYRNILSVFVYDAAEKIRKAALDAVYSFAVPEESAALVKAVETLTRVNGVNVKNARRSIADKLIEDNSYKF
jgi:hypothetical protein